MLTEDVSGRPYIFNPILSQNLQKSLQNMSLYREN